MKTMLRRLTTWWVRAMFPGEFFWDPRSVVRVFGPTPTSAMSMASRVLIHRVLEEEADSVVLTLCRVSFDGHEEGDWIVTVKRAPAPEETHDPGEPWRAGE